MRGQSHSIESGLEAMAGNMLATQALGPMFDSQLGGIASPCNPRTGEGRQLDHLDSGQPILIHH